MRLVGAQSALKSCGAVRAELLRGEAASAAATAATAAGGADLETRAGPRQRAGEEGRRGDERKCLLGDARDVVAQGPGAQGQRRPARDRPWRLWSGCTAAEDGRKLGEGKQELVAATLDEGREGHKERPPAALGSGGWGGRAETARGGWGEKEVREDEQRGRDRARLRQGGRDAYGGMRRLLLLRGRLQRVRQDAQAESAPRREGGSVYGYERRRRNSGSSGRRG